MLDSRQKCLETRMSRHGYIRRRYLMDDGTRMTTIEAPLAVWKGTGRIAKNIAAHINGGEIRASAAARKRLVLKLTAEGILSNVQIAREAGCTETRVRQIVAEAKKKGGAS
jgi:DNA-binding NarL/FixJ family response regulator